MPSPSATSPRRIHLWQHGRAVRHMLRAYPPDTDALIDQLRSGGVLRRVAFQHVLFPLYFAREQGWMIRGEMAAIMYLRREQRKDIRVLHIDDINVDARYRGQGLAHRLMLLAEDLARREQRPLLKLAVTAANTPAVTLYRRLGYQEQRYRYFTFVPSPPSPSATTATTADLTLRPLDRRQAAETLQGVYEMEVAASVPVLAPMLATYYPLHVPREAQRMYAIEQDGRLIGYGDLYLRTAQWNLDFGLQPALWGTATERQAVQRLTELLPVDGANGYTPGSPVALHLPSAAHADALCAGSPSLASELGLVEQRYDRMIMVKVLGERVVTARRCNRPVRGEGIVGRAGVLKSLG
ncbi:MAG TPA: GNAT family N-acetyltransferase [Ktedonobacterales bacterium]